MDNNNTKIEITQLKDFALIENCVYCFSDHFDPPLCQVVDDMALLIKKFQVYACFCVASLLNKDKESPSCCDDVLGICVFYANDMSSRNAYLTLICVRKDLVNRKIGEQLLKYCINQSRKNQMRLLRLQVNKNNTIAIRFYKKHGFLIEKEADENSFYMVKDLMIEM